jgi:formamidopyrimidine-DNA glycosylase
MPISLGSGRVDGVGCHARTLGQPAAATRKLSTAGAQVAAHRSPVHTVGVPELPEITALAAFLTEHATGQPIAAVTVASLNVLSTYDPPPSALVGRVIAGAGRYGKFLDIVIAPDSGPDVDPADNLHLVIHLARAGWLRWSDSLTATPPKMGGPIALRVRLAVGGFDITEAGTKKSVAAAIVRDPATVPGVARLGPDALSLDRDAMGRVLAGRSGRLKTVLTDQTVIAGIGNAYSDEILHTAKLSPFATAGRVTPAELDRLFAAMSSVLGDAVRRSVGAQAARLKGEKRTGLRVHARTGLPCPVCGDVVAEVSFADRSFQYCPTCQTGGKKLADRRMSRLVR